MTNICFHKRKSMAQVIMNLLSNVLTELYMQYEIADLKHDALKYS